MTNTLRLLASCTGIIVMVGTYNWGSIEQHPMLAVPMTAGAMLLLIGVYWETPRDKR